jgi:hypothetical protein
LQIPASGKYEVVMLANPNLPQQRSDEYQGVAVGSPPSERTQAITGRFRAHHPPNSLYGVAMIFACGLLLLESRSFHASAGWRATDLAKLIDCQPKSKWHYDFHRLQRLRSTKQKISV